jgi:hypothetical protein
MIPPFSRGRQRTAEDGRLASLGGRLPPRELVVDLGKIDVLPEPARRHLWELLTPCLAAVSPADLPERVRRFCDEHGASASELGDIIGAARHLVRAASLLGLSRTVFAEDLAKIPGGAGIAAVLVPGYDAGKALVQRELTSASLDDHGKRLAGLDWRLDASLASHRGALLGTPIVTLTLRYDEGREPGRLTLQTSLDGVRELHQACARILEQAGASPEIAPPAEAEATKSKAS